MCLAVEWHRSLETCESVDSVPVSLVISSSTSLFEDEGMLDLVSGGGQ